VRTLLDLAGAVGPRVLERAVDAAVSRRVVSLNELWWGVTNLQGRGRRGQASLRSLLVKRGSGAEATGSDLEQLMTRILKRAGLPRPQLQFAIKLRNGKWVRVDFAYAEQKIAIEVDGYLWHSSHSVFQLDRMRQNGLVEIGWRVLRYTWRDLTDRPDVVAAEVAAMLEVPIGETVVGRLIVPTEP
jgi:very-short-patch-repair endonuclease